MEPESKASIVSRRKRQLFSAAAELGVAALFVVTIFVASKVTATSIATKLVMAAAPIIVLSLWWYLYYRQIAALDELARSIAVRALAIACAVTIWVTTAWGLLHLFAGAPALPLVFVAPLAAVIYCAIRAALVLGYK